MPSPLMGMGQVLGMQPPPQPDQSNFMAAHQAMNLTPQEQSLYQLHLQNLYGSGGVDQPNGRRSSLYNTQFDVDGKTYIAPTVYGGQILPPAATIKKAFDQGLDKWPSYASPGEAENRYNKLHEYMNKDTMQYLQQRGQK